MTTNWLRTLTLYPEYGETDADNPEEVRNLASTIHQRLSDLQPLTGVDGYGWLLNQKRKVLEQRFLTLADDPKTDKHKFNQEMIALYDWADSIVRDDQHAVLGKCCWINTLGF